MWCWALLRTYDKYTKINRIVFNTNAYQFQFRQFAQLLSCILLFHCSWLVHKTASIVRTEMIYVGIHRRTSFLNLFWFRLNTKEQLYGHETLITQTMRVRSCYILYSKPNWYFQQYRNCTLIVGIGTISQFTHFFFYPCLYISEGHWINEVNFV